MGERIVITGCTRGLGRALVEPFIEAGHTVYGFGRSTEAIVALRERFSAPHDFESVDVTDFAAVEAFAKKILADGAPDRLVNNAGVINDPAPLWEVEPAVFAHIMNVNLTGVHHCIRAFVPAMVERGSGVIVNLSSGWGRSTSPEVAPYCASKWGVEGLSQALAQELPKGMAAVALNPGVIATDMLQQCFGESASGYPSPAQWAERAAPYILKIAPKANGTPLTVA
ncbi:MAG: SDR family oxidoreductase [Opitutales bacterium]